MTAQQAYNAIYFIFTYREHSFYFVYFYIGYLMSIAHIKTKTYSGADLTVVNRRFNRNQM